MNSKHQYLKACFFKILNLLGFSIFSLILKLKCQTLHTFIQFFLAHLGIIVLMMPLAIQRLITKRINIFNIKNYFFRALFSTLGLVCWMQCLKNLGITEATLISYFTPLFTAMLAILLLKEPLRPNWIIGLGMGFIGILLLSYNKSYSINNINLYGIILALAATLMWAFNDIICKIQASYNEDYILQVFITFVLSALFIIPFIPTSISKDIINNQIQVYWAFIAGIFGFISVIFLFLAYKIANVTSMTPHSYLRIIFVAAFMYFLNKEIPSSNLIAASIFIVSGNFYAVLKKNKD